MQGAELKNALILVEAYKIQYCRSIEKTWDSWLELILEINEYTRMDVIQQASERHYLLESLKESLGVAHLFCRGLPDECAEIIVRTDQIFERCITKIPESVEWIEQGS